MLTLFVVVPTSPNWCPLGEKVSLAPDDTRLLNFLDYFRMELVYKTVHEEITALSVLSAQA